MADPASPPSGTAPLLSVPSDDRIPDAVTPTLPKHLDEATQAEIVDSARRLGQRILDDPDDREAVEAAAMVGDAEIKEFDRNSALLQQSLSTTMQRLRTGQDNEIPQQIQTLAQTFDQLNPYPYLKRLNDSENLPGWQRSLKRAMGQLPSVTAVLREIAARYEQSNDAIERIMAGLERSDVGLHETILEVRERYDMLRALQKRVQVKLYQCELIWSEMDRLLSATELEEFVRQRATRARVRIARRALFLAQIDQAFHQFMVQMNSSMDRWEDLRDHIQALRSLARPVLSNGLALLASQEAEQQIVAALGQTQDYIGTLMNAVAEQAAGNALATTRVTSDALMRTQALVNAYRTLKTSITEISTLQEQMVVGFQGDLDTLKAMSNDLTVIARAQESARDMVGDAGRL